MDLPLQYVTDYEIYKQVIQAQVPATERFLWLATSDLKDLHVRKRSRMVPFLEILSDLVERGVSIRLLHAKEPGPLFQRDFDRYPNLLEGLERMLCPRVHFKSVIVDGRFAYSGSANLTGAGLGAKSENRRNFEAGFITTVPEWIDPILQQFDAVWIGKHCAKCGRKAFCADYRDLLSD